ncbi:UNVERIFIED_ORG: hypothetical protein ABIC48_006870 [Burkholderia territorii]
MFKLMSPFSGTKTSTGLGNAVIVVARWSAATAANAKKPMDRPRVDTAGAFYDAFFRMEFDASRIIIVLTANDLDRVPLPLLSRVEVFDIPTPDPEQRMQIILAKIDHLQRSTGKHIQLEEGGATGLAERTDLDLRKLHRIVIDAFAVALATGKCIATLALPPSAKRQPIGFTCHG